MQIYYIYYAIDYRLSFGEEGRHDLSSSAGAIKYFYCGPANVLAKKGKERILNKQENVMNEIYDCRRVKKSPAWNETK